MNNQKTELILADPSMTGGEGAYIEYSYTGIKAGSWVCLDVGAVVRENQQVWLKSIEDWHQGLCVWGSKKSNFWWLNNASRLTVWVPFDLRPLIYARAVLELCATQEHSRIYLFGMSEEVIAYLREWEHHDFANYRLIGASKAVLRAKAAVSLILARTVLQLTKLLLVWMASIRPTNQSPRNIDLFVYSTPLAAHTIVSKGDHYFGRVFEGVDGSRAKLEWLYEAREFSNLDSIRKALHDTGRTFHFALGYLKIQDVLMVIIGALRELARLKSIADNMPILVVGAIPCVGFPVNFARQAIFTIPPVWEIALLYAFRRYLQVVKPKAVIYPYEEKGGERALIQACDSVTPKVVIIAFAHAVYSHGILYVHKDIQRPMPRYMAVTGIATKKWFNSWGGLSLESLRVVGSPKFVSESDEDRPQRNYGDSRRILFVCGVGHEISRLVKFAMTRSDVFAHSILRIRKYPYSWQEQQDEDILELKKCGINVLVENQALDEEIEWADVVLFTGTSAALEAMLRNKPCVRIVDSTLDMNPLAGRDCDGAVADCDSADELCDCLDTIFSLNDEAYEKMVAAQRALAVNIFSEWNSSVLEEMIVSI